MSETDRETDRQTDRQTDGRTDRQIEGQTDKDIVKFHALVYDILPPRKTMLGVCLRASERASERERERESPRVCMCECARACRAGLWVHALLYDGHNDSVYLLMNRTSCDQNTATGMQHLACVCPREIITSFPAPPPPPPIIVILSILTHSLPQPVKCPG